MGSAIPRQVGLEGLEMVHFVRYATPMEHMGGGGWKSHWTMFFWVLWHVKITVFYNCDIWDNYKLCNWRTESFNVCSFFDSCQSPFVQIVTRRDVWYHTFQAHLILQFVIVTEATLELGTVLVHSRC